MSTAQPQARIVAFPSLAHSLAGLPKATNVASVTLHYPMSPTSAHSQESEDKLRRALAMTGATHQSMQQHYTTMSSSPDSNSSGDYIMMGRKSVSARTHLFPPRPQTYRPAPTLQQR